MSRDYWNFPVSLKFPTIFVLCTLRSTNFSIEHLHPLSNKYATAERWQLTLWYLGGCFIFDRSSSRQNSSGKRADNDGCLCHIFECDRTAYTYLPACSNDSSFHVVQYWNIMQIWGVSAGWSTQLNHSIAWSRTGMMLFPMGLFSISSIH